MPYVIATKGLADALAELSTVELSDERMVYVVENDHTDAYLILMDHGWTLDRSRTFLSLTPPS